MKEQRLKKLQEICLQCQQCNLCRSRNRLVFGEGNPDASVIFVGEAPGKEEDFSGRPFVGRSGKLLRQMLSAININPHDQYIANILKCRPPNNRKPTMEEMAECRKFIIKQIDIIEPELIVCLGKTAAEGFFPDKTDESVTNLRSISKQINELQFQGIPVIVTYHPSALLQSPKWRPLAAEDFRFIQKLYDKFSIRKENVRLEEHSLFVDPL